MNTIYDILAIAIVTSPHIKIKYIPVQNFKTLSIKGFWVIKHLKQAQSTSTVLTSPHSNNIRVIMLI